HGRHAPSPQRRPLRPQRATESRTCAFRSNAPTDFRTIGRDDVREAPARIAPKTWRAHRKESNCAQVPDFAPKRVSQRVQRFEPTCREPNVLFRESPRVMIAAPTNSEKRVHKRNAPASQAGFVSGFGANWAPVSRLWPEQSRRGNWEWPARYAAGRVR